MPIPGIRRVRMRTRLAVVIILSAAVSSGALALGSYLIVRNAFLQDSLNRSQVEARVDLELAAGTRFAAPSFDKAGFVQAYETRGVHVVVTFPGGRVASDPRVDPLLPTSVSRLVAAGQLGYARLEVGGTPYLVVGGRAPASDGDLYFFFSEQAISTNLAQLMTVLLAAWGVVVVAAALLGRAVARRALDPVARASDAARSVAAGLLETRLPASGSDEFSTWAASFNDMAAALEAKIDALAEAELRERRFTADVAHELRTPLAALVAEASVLRDQLDTLPAGSRRPAELMIGDVSRLRHLVEDLLEISRLEAAPPPLQVAELGLRALIEQLVGARGWEGRVRVTGEDFLVESDSRSLERIIGNLVDNAVEHGGGAAVVALSQAHGNAQVTVTDHGPGIDPAHLGRVFDRFYKADAARASTGSGLGLAIAAEHTRRIGGELTVSSEPGDGATFILTLPPIGQASGTGAVTEL